MKSSLVAIGFLTLCFPAIAQETTNISPALVLSAPEIFNKMDSAALLQGLPMLTLLDGKTLPILAELGRMGTTPVHLAWDTPSTIVKAHKAGNVSRHQTDGKDFHREEKNVSVGIMNAASDPIRYGGEVGVFYGHSTGKISADEFGSYIDAGIGTDKFQFNFGVSGSELDFHVPRGRH